MEATEIFQTRHIAKGVVYLFISMATSAICTFVFMIIAGRYLGVLDYGILSVAWTVLVLLTGLSTAGLGYAASKYIPEYAVQGEKENVKIVLLTTCRYALLLGLAAGICLFLVADLISEKVYGGGFTTAFKIVGLTLPLNAVFTVVLASFIGFQRMKFHLFANASGGILKLVVAPILLIMAGVSGGLLSITAGFVLSTIIAVFFIGRTIKINRKDVIKFRNPNISQRIVWFSLPGIVIATAGLILRQGGIILLSLLDTKVATGLFAADFVLVSPVLLVTGAVGTAVVPTFSGLWVLQKKVEVQRFQTALIKYILWIMLPILALYLAVPDIMLRIFYGAEYVLASNTLRLLAIGSFILLVHWIFSAFLIGIGKMMEVLYITVSGAILSVVLSVLLIPGYGIIGVGIAFLAGCSVYIVIGIRYVRKLIGFTLPPLT